jgi:hypothetical protein
MTQSFAQYYRALKPGRWMTVEFHNSANSVWNSIQEALERVGFVVADVRVLTKEHNTFKQVNSAAAVKSDLVISCYKPRYSFEERFKQVQGKPEGVVEFLREHLAMLPVAPINKAGRLETVAERTRFLLFDRMVAYHLQHGARIPLSAADFYKLLEEQFVERDEMSSSTSNQPATMRSRRGEWRQSSCPSLSAMRRPPCSGCAPGCSSIRRHSAT